MTLFMKQLMVRDYPAEERPRERMIHDGPEKLTNQDLLAILLRTGTKNESVFQLASRILSECQSVRQLADTSIDELMQIRGVGKAKAVQIKAAVELGRRVVSKQKQRFCIHSPHDAAQYLMERIGMERQEKFLALFLDTKNQIVHEKVVFVGSLNASIVHPREVYKEAVKWSAASILVAHNHPSGDPDPSEEDLRVTRRLVDAGQILGIECLDHLIIGDHRYISLKEKGYM